MSARASIGFKVSKIKKRDGQIRSSIVCSDIHRKTTILTSIGVLD
jgi:hypothetical protein